MSDGKELIKTRREAMNKIVIGFLFAASTIGAFYCLVPENKKEIDLCISKNELNQPYHFDWTVTCALHGGDYVFCSCAESEIIKEFGYSPTISDSEEDILLLNETISKCQMKQANK